MRDGKMWGDKIGVIECRDQYLMHCVRSCIIVDKPCQNGTNKPLVTFTRDWKTGAMYN